MNNNILLLKAISGENEKGEKMNGYKLEEPWKIWIQRWKQTQGAIEKIGGKCSLKIYPPSTEEQIKEIERQLNVQLPLSFRWVLLEFASRLEFAWTLPDHSRLSKSLHRSFLNICEGNCHWNLYSLLQLESSRKANGISSNIWQNKLLFHEINNGDFLAIDLREADGSVIYLSLEDDVGICHGYTLGENFIDFMDRWTSIGCPGAEDWHLVPFISSTAINSDGERSEKWRKWLGISIN